MREYDRLIDLLTAGSAHEIETEAARYGLTRGLHASACDYCRRGVHTGYDHRECMTLVPISECQY